MTDIFFSYAREDQTRIEPVVRLLEGAGWSVFWDIDIPPGETWRSWITRHLQDAHCVLVAWSSISVEKRWVLEEVDEAERLGKLVFPILLEDILPPLGHRQTQAAKFSNWGGDADDPVAVSLLKQLTLALRPPAAPELQTSGLKSTGARVRRTSRVVKPESEERAEDSDDR